MYLIKRIIRAYITVAKIIVHSIIDIIRLCFSPLSLALKLVTNLGNKPRMKRYTDNIKTHKHDRYQSQIDGINRVIKDIKLSINTDHWYIKSALNGDRDTRLSERIDSANKLAEIKKFHLDDAIKQIQGLNNRVNELELCREDSTLTIFPDNEEMTIDEHVQHAMAAHEREEGRVKEYDYHSELRAKEDKLNE